MDVLRRGKHTAPPTPQRPLEGDFEFRVFPCHTASWEALLFGAKSSRAVNVVFPIFRATLGVESAFEGRWFRS